MARDSSIFARRAGLTLLRAAASVADIVSARVYPPQRPANPVWPFLAWGVATAVPFEASCMDGARVSFALHAYAATEGSGSGTVSGEEQAAALAAAAAAVLVDAGEIDLEGYGCPFPAIARFTWEQTQVIQDGAEADAFHAVVAMRCEIVS